jgi:hypothetical protein
MFFLIIPVELFFSKGGGFGFGGAKNDFLFTGAGAPVFGQGASAKKDASAAHDDDNDQVEGAGKKIS